MYNFAAAILRAFGDTKRPLLFLVISGSVNVCLNLLLVIVFHLDVAGVAIATVISQYISLVLVLRCLARAEGLCRLHLREVRLYRDEAVRMLLIFYLTFNVIGAFLSNLLAQGISALSVLVDRGLTSYGLNPVVHSLVIDGIFKGVGSVLSFLPVIVTLFFFLSILEDTGYMSRWR